jgi:hypothetical protein
MNFIVDFCRTKVWVGKAMQLGDRRGHNWPDSDTCFTMRGRFVTEQSGTKHWIVSFMPTALGPKIYTTLSMAVKARRNTYGSYQSLPWGTSRAL